MSAVRFAAKRAIIPTKLAVMNLSWLTGESQLLNYFSKFGKVKHINLGMRSNGFPSGFAIITFAKEEDANKVINSMDLHKLDSKIIQVKQFIQ